MADRGGRPANASAARQAAFVEGREAEQARRRNEAERCRELRASGVEDQASYRPADWSDEHGSWLVPVPELLKVSLPDVVTGRQERSTAAAHNAERERAEAEAASRLGAALAEQLTT